MVIALAIVAWLLLVCAVVALCRAASLEARDAPTPEPEPPVWYWRDYRADKPLREPADEQRGA